MEKISMVKVFTMMPHMQSSMMISKMCYLQAGYKHILYY